MWHNYLRTGVIAAVLCGVPVTSAGDQTSCVIELDVYGPKGERLNFEIKAISFYGDQTKDNERHGRILYKGGRALFSSERLPAVFNVTLTGEAYMARFRRVVDLKYVVEAPSCRTRVTLRHGIDDSDVDLSFTSVAGHIKGCDLSKNWWVRLMPMFGAITPGSALDGFLDSSAGSFTVNGAIEGVRHLVIIGKGTEPVSVTAVDVVSNSRTDVGEIDVSKSCAKK